jgi:ribosome-associated protein
MRKRAGLLTEEISKIPALRKNCYRLGRALGIAEGRGTRHPLQWNWNPRMTKPIAAKKKAGLKKQTDLKKQVSEAIAACRDKKAEDITLLELDQDSGAFTDYFVVCSGTNAKQIQTISDAVEDRLEAAGHRPVNKEGYKQAEWVLLDYLNFVVHIFTEKARKYYDLERLWKTAKKLEPSELKAIRKRAAVGTVKKKRA